MVFVRLRKQLVKILWLDLRWRHAAQLATLLAAALTHLSERTEDPLLLAVPLVVALRVRLRVLGLARRVEQLVEEGLVLIKIDQRL